SFLFNDTTGLFFLDNTLFSMDTDFNIDSLLDISFYMDSVYLIKKIDGELWLAGMADNDTIRIIQTDHQLNVSNIYSVVLDKFIPLNFSVRQDTLILYGNEIVSPFNNEFSLAVKRYYLPLISDNFNYDAAITSSFFEVYNVAQTPSFPFFGAAITVTGKLSITIKNEGTNTIDSLIIRSAFDKSFPYNCTQFYSNTFPLNSLNLLPGASVDFTFDSLYYATSTLY